MKAFFATILIIPLAFAAAAQEHTDSLSAKNLSAFVLFFLHLDNQGIIRHQTTK